MADEKASIAERAEIMCKFGFIDGRIVRLPKGGDFIEKFVSGSTVTIYAGSDKRPVNVNIGYRIWCDKLGKRVFCQVFVPKRGKASTAIDKFLSISDEADRYVDLSFDGGTNWHHDVLIPANHSILQVVDYLLMPPPIK